MKRMLTIFLAIGLVFGLVSMGSAALYDRGNGLIYDDAQNLTWLQDANYAGEFMDWYTAMEWVGVLNYKGITGWRLPTFDPHEMLSLYNVLKAGGAPPWDPFINVVTGTKYNGFDVGYWTSTESSTDPNKAYRFFFDNGNTGTPLKIREMAAWPVIDGDVGQRVVPLPAPILLLGSGLIGLVGLKRRLKK